MGIVWKEVALSVSNKLGIAALRSCSRKLLYCERNNATAPRRQKQSGPLRNSDAYPLSQCNLDQLWWLFAHPSMCWILVVLSCTRCIFTAQCSVPNLSLHWYCVKRVLCMIRSKLMLTWHQTWHFTWPYISLHCLSSVTHRGHINHFEIDASEDWHEQTIANVHQVELNLVKIIIVWQNRVYCILKVSVALSAQSYQVATYMHCYLLFMVDLWTFRNAPL